MTTKINRQKQKPKNRGISWSLQQKPILRAGWSADADAMGAFFNEELSFPPVHANFASSQEQLIRFSKNVHDNVHGNIYLDPVRNFYYIFFLILSNFGHKHSVNVSEEIMILCYCIVLYCSSSLWSLLTLSSFRGKLTLSFYFYILFLKNIFFELFSYLQWLLQLFYVVNDQICFSYYRLRDLKQLGKFPRGKKREAIGVNGGI